MTGSTRNKRISRLRERVRHRLCLSLGRKFFSRAAQLVDRGVASKAIELPLHDHCRNEIYRTSCDEPTASILYPRSRTFRTCSPSRLSSAPNRCSRVRARSVLPDFLGFSVQTLFAVNEKSLSRFTVSS